MAASTSQPRTPDATERVRRFLDRLEQEKFFGKVVLTLQNGKVGDVRIEQTRKINEL
jgi:hypothetical protein